MKTYTTSSLVFSAIILFQIAAPIFCDSRIGQVFWAGDNLGDILASKGIQKLLGEPTREYRIASYQPLNVNHVNQNCKCLIVGAAGLFHKNYSRMYQDLAAHLQIPIILWGVGLCLNKKHSPVGADRSAVQQVAHKAILVNVRDALTKDYYGLKNSSVAVCPTLAFLDDYRDKVTPQNILIVEHPDLLDATSRQSVRKMAQDIFKTTPLIIDHRCKTLTQALQIVEKYYCKAKLVITSRLHGAVIAYGLGIPYIAINGDQKIESFWNNYGNGILVDHISEIPQAIAQISDIPMAEPNYKDMYIFAQRAKEEINKICAANKG